MSFPVWIFWFVLAAVFVVGEIFTAGFFLLWFGVGAAAAGGLALLEVGFGWQLAVFVAVAGILFAASRRLAERISRPQPPGIGADRFVGKRGRVLEAVDPSADSGRVRLGKEEWRAESETGEAVPAGVEVEVVRLEGTHLVVRILEKES
jgi:membrane protein implicated in regulation of membrane protease activity